MKNKIRNKKINKKTLTNKYSLYGLLSNMQMNKDKFFVRDIKKQFRDIIDYVTNIDSDINAIYVSCYFKCILDNNINIVKNKIVSPIGIYLYGTFKNLDIILTPFSEDNFLAFFGTNQNIKIAKQFQNKFQYKRMLKFNNIH